MTTELIAGDDITGNDITIYGGTGTGGNGGNLIIRGGDGSIINGYIKIETPDGLNTSEVRFYDETDSEYVGLQADTSLSSSVTWKLPNTPGTATQMLTLDKSDPTQMTWVNRDLSEYYDFGPTTTTTDTFTTIGSIPTTAKSSIAINVVVTGINIGDGTGIGVGGNLDVETTNMFYIKGHFKNLTGTTIEPIADFDEVSKFQEDINTRVNLKAVGANIEIEVRGVGTDKFKWYARVELDVFTFTNP